MCSSLACSLLLMTLLSRCEVECKRDKDGAQSEREAKIELDQLAQNWMQHQQMSDLPSYPQTCLAQKTQVPTGKALRSSDRVWLHMMQSNLALSYIYEPVLISLQEAFEEAGATAVITDDTHNNSAVLMGVRKALAQGHQPLVVAVAFPWSNHKEFLRKLSDAGAYVVFYQTEPMPRGHPHFEGTLKLMEMSGAKELWDYSRANLAYFEKHMSEKQKAKFKIRYMPPGYARGLDWGVDLESSVQSTSSIGFLGFWKNERPKAVSKKYHKLLGASLHSETHALTFEALKTYLSKYPMQLIAHKHQNCCPSDNAMESLRLAVLLSNKACVISAPADPLDEDYWKGVVHFASIEETPALQKRLQGDLKACRQKSYETFRACFSVGRILEQSGFLDAWPLPLTPHSRQLSTSRGVTGNPNHNPSPIQSKEHRLQPTGLASVAHNSWVAGCGIILVFMLMASVFYHDAGDEGRIIVCAFVWMMLSGSLTLYNAWMFSPTGGKFPFVICLACWHMLLNTMVSLVVRLCFPSQMPAASEMSITWPTITKVAPPAVLLTVTLILGNKAYLYLSVAVIQMIKAGMPLMTYMISCSLGMETLSTSIMGAVGLLISGILLIVTGDIQLSMLGLGLQMTSFVAEGLRLVSLKWLLSSHGFKLDPLSGLFFYSPIAFIFLFALIFATGEVWQVASLHQLPIMHLLTNGVLACGLNVASVFLMSGVDATTFAVCGAMKDVTIVALSAWLFHNHVGYMQIGGFVLTLIAVRLYNHVKQSADEGEKHVKQSTGEGENHGYKRVINKDAGLATP